MSVSLPECRNLKLTKEHFKPGMFLGLSYQHHYYLYLGSDAVLIYPSSDATVYPQAGWNEFKKAKAWHVCLPA